MKTVNTGVKLEESLHARLKAHGLSKDRTPHWLMKAAIEECVAREERYVGEKLEDIKRWERYQASGHSISQER
jgi:predicted transcriptional regulator